MQLQSVGSYTDGYFVQDHSGFVTVNDSGNSKLEMYGNAWKTYKLPYGYEVTKDTLLRFKLSVGEEVEGHAVCVHEERSGGGVSVESNNRRRCTMLAGSDYASWTGVEKAMDVARGKSATQSTTGGNNLHAGYAVGGNEPLHH